MKFETSRILIHLLSDVFICCHPEILLLWQRDVTTSPLCIYLDANKFGLLSVFTLLETICQKVRAKPLFKNAKSPLRLTSVAQNRLCLSFLLCIQDVHSS